MSKLFHLSKNNRFGLEYPSVEKRQKIFRKLVLQKYGAVYSACRELENYRSIGTLANFFSLVNSPINDLDNWLKFHYIFIDKDIEANYSNFYFYILDDKELSFEELLFILDQFLSLFEKYLEELVENNILLDTDFELTKNSFTSIKHGLAHFDLGYFWNSETLQIERKLDQANTLIINNNLENVDSDFEYSKCIDEFLKPNKEKNYLDSLINLRRVFERVLTSKGFINGMSNKAGRNKIIDFINSGKKNEQLEKSLDFILKNIHHDDEKNGGKPYKFAEKEYIYWWLEINKLIFILNN